MSTPRPPITPGHTPSEEPAGLHLPLPPDLKPDLAQTLMLLGLWKACEDEYVQTEARGDVIATLRPEAAERRVHTALKILLPPDEVAALITGDLSTDVHAALTQAHAYLQAAWNEHLALLAMERHRSQDDRERANELFDIHGQAEQRTNDALRAITWTEALIHEAWALSPKLWNQEVGALLEHLHRDLPLISRRPGTERRLRREHLAAQLTVRAEWDWLQSVRAARGEPIIRPEIKCVATGLLPKGP